MWRAWAGLKIEALGKASCTLGLLCCLASNASATVLEYDTEGKLTVTEKQTEVAALPQRSQEQPSTEILKLKELTRTVAVRFSGEPGVRKAGLDALTFVEVFEKLIAAESNFDPKVVSAKGAMGLGQLMPDTASELNVTDPFEPHQNLVGAAQYFTKQLLEFGSLELALAAYNAGPERVKEHKGVPPFKETRDYIAKITRNSGIQSEAPKPAASPPAAVPINKEEPLKGETSVWEF